MRKTVLMLVTLFAGLTSTAQELLYPDAAVRAARDASGPSSVIVHWGDRPLRESDFGISDGQWHYRDSIRSDIRFQRRVGRTHGGNMHYTYVKYEPVFHGSGSSVAKGSMSRRRLDFASVCFDLAEVYARAMTGQPDSLCGRYKDAYESAVRDVALNTDCGNRKELLSSYAADVAGMLDSLPDSLPVPGLGDYNAGFAAYCHGMGSALLGNDFKRSYALGLPASIDAGVSFLRGKYSLSLDYRWQPGFIEEEQKTPLAVWTPGSRSDINTISLLYGWRLYDSSWWELKPYAGVGYCMLTLEDAENAPMRYGAGGVSYQAGIDAVLKPLRIVRYSGYRGLGLSARFFVAGESIPDADSFVSFNLGIGFSIEGGTRIIIKK